METNVDTTPALVSETPATAVSPSRNQLYSKEFKIVGVTQIMVGTLSIMTWIYALTLAVSTRTTDVFVYISAGIWAGIFFLIAGILALVSSVKPNNRNVGAGIAMALFAAIFATAMLGIEAAGIGTISNFSSMPMPYTVYSPTGPCTPFYKPSYYKSGTYIPSCRSPYRSPRYISSVYISSTYLSCPSRYTSYNTRYYNYLLHQSRMTTIESLYGIRITLVVIHAFLAFFALIETIVAIIHSVYCCKFHMAPAPQPVVQYTTTYPQVNFTGIAQQMPATSIGQPIGGAFQNTVYPVTSVPYQAPYYINQATVIPNQQQVVTPISTQSIPNYSVNQQQVVTPISTQSIPNYSVPQNPQPLATPMATPMSPATTPPTQQPLPPPNYDEASKATDNDFPTS